MDLAGLTEDDFLFSTAEDKRGAYVIVVPSMDRIFTPQMTEFLETARCETEDSF